MKRDIAVCIPSIPPRGTMLTRAIASVATQNLAPHAVCVAVDHERRGAAVTRNEAWRMARTEWVAFLDDDDELLPQHLQHCLDEAEEHGADLVYPWHFIIGPEGRRKPDLLAGQGVDFDPAELDVRNFIPVTLIVRRELLEAIGGFPVPGTEDWPHQDCEDWACWRRLVAVGAKFHHTPEVTWLWHHHGKNTSGRGDRWPGPPTWSPAE